MVDTVSQPLSPATDAGLKAKRLGRGGWSWVFFESGRIPQLLLISSFVFVPYFATVIADSPVHGQSLLAAVGTTVGLGFALLAPLLGATVDKHGPRKPWLAACVVVLAPLLFSLWWARPDQSGLGMIGILVVLASLNAFGGLADLMFNSMMPFAVGRRGAAKASGTALALANVVGVAALIFVLWYFELPGKAHLPGVPAQPLFGLKHATYEPARIVGPIAAAILLICATPLFLFAPDGPRSGKTLPAAMKEGFRDLVALLRQAPTVHANLAKYLAARVVYGDAVGAYIGFSGVYAAGVMGWRGPEMLLFGVFSAVFCGAGALLGQALDRTLGPRRALIIEIIGMSVFILGEIGMSQTQILYMAYDPAAHAPLWAGPLFPNVADLVFLGLTFGAAMMLVATAASSRTMLVRLTPRDQVGSVFGLAALTGSATNWLAPLLIGVFTATWESQQAGFVPLLILLGLGLVGMLFVRGGDRFVDGKDD